MHKETMLELIQSEENTCAFKHHCVAQHHALAVAMSKILDMAEAVRVIMDLALGITRKSDPAKFEVVKKPRMKAPRCAG